MVRRIELVNFMSHARTVIEPADGLTVLVGPNNCGKSAVVTALQILCHNDNSTYVTRHNEKECTVTVETDEGHTVQWCRKNDSPRYTVNGQPFDRLGIGQIPEDLHKILRLARVKAESNQEFDIHFGEQKSPVFLLDKPGSHAAQFFASSSDAASLVEMQKRHKRKMADGERERDRLAEQAAKLKGDLDALSATDQIKVSVGQVELAHQELLGDDAGLQQMTVVIEEFGHAYGLMNRRQSELAAFCGLRPPPDISETLPLATLTRDLLSAHSRSARLDAECGATRDLQPPPVTTETESGLAIVARMQEWRRRISELSQRLVAMATLPTVPELGDEVGLNKDIQALAHAASTLRRAEVTKTCLSDLVPLPNLSDLGDLEITIRKITATAETMACLSRNAEVAGQSLLESERLMGEWAKQNPICSLCHGRVNAKTLIEHAKTCDGDPSNV